ncbi:hypothetical protein SAMN05216559_2950 [Halomicrobium zhouii]|uniref:Uncharacterized protein n=1 Tax=Halomicrobium zhouii TaxID=767519 RepID=A0A1I6LR62_9EURY|nr:hypothetical protein [Halomicrobium zhouii]SFS05956.1 hypothetical protein SAMN05216559_2950 [Halomicrobium zhouii]
MSNMQDVDHTHPHTDEPFGAAFRRGPDVAADGGERTGSESTDEQQTDDEAMEDVDHESPTEGANRTFERGTEGRDESV